MRSNRGEGEVERNVGGDRSLSLLRAGRGVPSHAPAIQELLYLSELWSSDDRGSLQPEVRLSEVPADGCDRSLLPQRGAAAQASATESPDALGDDALGDDALISLAGSACNWGQLG